MRRTILVVEDDAGEREVLCSLLEEHGYACIAVEDGQRALDLLASRTSPDAVLLDLVLPRVNGHEFLLELDERGERSLAVVLMSGFGPVSRFADLPLVREVVQKPVDLGPSCRRCRAAWTAGPIRWPPADDDASGVRAARMPTSSGAAPARFPLPDGEGRP